MTTCRLHFVSEARIVSGQQVEAVNDRAAKFYVHGRRGGRAAELWDRTRVLRN